MSPTKLSYPQDPLLPHDSLHGELWAPKLLRPFGVHLLTLPHQIGAAVFCVVKAVQNMSESAIFAQIVVSIVSTYGCYVVASIIACDPWHLLTCFAQYLLFAPIYINLLNIFAFSNLHDFSWGTKEQTTAEIDLGVTRKVGKDTVDMNLPSDQTDIDAAYDLSLHSLKTRPMIVPPPLSLKAKEEAAADYFQSVRTNVLLLWVLSNVSSNVSTLQLQPS